MPPRTEEEADVDSDATHCGCPPGVACTHYDQEQVRDHAVNGARAVDELFHRRRLAGDIAVAEQQAAKVPRLVPVNGLQARQVDHANSSPLDLIQTWTPSDAAAGAHAAPLPLPASLPESIHTTQTPPMQSDNSWLAAAMVAMDHVETHGLQHAGAQQLNGFAAAVVSLELRQQKPHSVQSRIHHFLVPSAKPIPAPPTAAAAHVPGEDSFDMGASSDGDAIAEDGAGDMEGASDCTGATEERAKVAAHGTARAPVTKPVGKTLAQARAAGKRTSEPTEYRGIHKLFGVNSRPYKAQLEIRGKGFKWSSSFATEQEAYDALKALREEHGLPPPEKVMAPNRCCVCFGHPHRTRGFGDCPVLLEMEPEAAAKTLLACKGVQMLRCAFRAPNLMTASHATNRLSHRGSDSHARRVTHLNHSDAAMPEVDVGTLPQWRARFWSEMRDESGQTPVFPRVAPIPDPHSGRPLHLEHVVQTRGGNGLLQKAMRISVDRNDNSDASHALGNFTLTAAIFNMWIRGELTIELAYIKMASWLRTVGDIEWPSNPGKIPCGGARCGSKGDPERGRYYVEYARDCYKRHRDCTEACAACKGVLLRGRLQYAEEHEIPLVEVR